MRHWQGLGHEAVRRVSMFISFGCGKTYSYVDFKGPLF